MARGAGESSRCDLNEQHARKQARLALPEKCELIEFRAEGGKVFGA